jgi:glycine betaine/proline transport system substrate-binding protein
MTTHTLRSRVLAALLACMLALGGTAAAQASECGVDRPIVFADLDWDSAQVLNEVVRSILEEGWGCATDSIPGSTLPMLQGAIRGDIDIYMELWTDNVPEFWEEAVAAGTVVELNAVFDDATQGFYVPRYLVEGDAERGIEALAPDLRHVEDLPQYAHLFRDPEQPDKGRFYNCIIGWYCEGINNVKFHVYDMDEHFTNFRPGTGVALATTMQTAYLRGEPWFGYYWAPTWVLGALDMIRLEEPAYDEACWEHMNAYVDTPEQATMACAYPQSAAVVVLGSRYKDQVPDDILTFLSSIRAPSAVINDLLAFMQESDATPGEAARNFLATNPDLWTFWLDDVDDVYLERVRAALR